MLRFKLEILKWAALGLALAALPAASSAPGPEGEASILSRTGDLYLVDDQGGHAFVPAGVRYIPRDSTFEAGTLAEPGAPQVDFQQLPEDQTAIQFSPRETVTLVSGSRVRRSESKAGRADFRMSGPVHLLIRKGERAADAGPLDLGVNGVGLRTASAHLFFDGWASPPQIAVVSGEVDVLQGTVAGGEKAGAGKRIVLDPSGARIAEGGAGPVQIWSAIPGFETPESFRPVGLAAGFGDALKVTRSGILSHLVGSRIVLLEGDRIAADPAQEVQILFDSGDRVLLTGPAEFHVETVARKDALPSDVFSLVGKVRAWVQARAPGSIVFKTQTATIGIKGTDLEIAAPREHTEVSVVEGTVGVADRNGVGGVEVRAGFSTRVPDGQKPLAPAPIPPERLKSLHEERREFERKAKEESERAAKAERGKAEKGAKEKVTKPAEKPQAHPNAHPQRPARPERVRPHHVK